jgi:hypothetical protein
VPPTTPSSPQSRKSDDAPLAADPARAGYNWHPAVHSAYEESLYFILIRLREPLHRPVADQIRDILAVADVRFACEYSIFGHWDALLRIWLTHGAYERLYRLLDKKDENNIDNFETFAATEIRYLWNGSEANLLSDDSIPKTLARNKRHIEAAVRTPEAVDTKTWRKLKTAGLILDRHKPKRPVQSVKFYIALQRVADVPAKGELDAVLDALRECKMTGCSSLYVGKAWFAAYLVRCVSTRYSGVLEFSRALDIALRRMPLRPMTLLVANVDAEESDGVNDARSLSRRSENTLELLNVEDGPSKFTSLGSHDWDALAELVDRAHELADDNISMLPRLLAPLRACLKDDHDELARALAFLADSESFLAEYVIESWMSTLGKDWFRKLKQHFEVDQGLARSAEELKKDKDEDWTAGSYAHFARATASFSDLFDARLRRQLSPNWKQQMLQYAELRNKPAHGKLRAMGHLDTFASEPLRGLLDELLDVIALCSRFRHFAENSGLDDG